MNTLRRILAAFAAVILLGLGTAAQAAYPDKPLRIIWPYSAGGLGEALGRLLAHELSSRLGQPVIVESKPGGAGIVGFLHVKTAPPDGYTLLLGSLSPMSLAPSLRADLPYDPQQDYEPIAMTFTSPYLMVVPASSPARTLREFAAMVKAQNGRLNYATSGNATSSHLLGALFNMRNGTTMTPVPYKGDAPALTGLMAGDTQLFFASMTVMPHVASGRLRALAVTTTSRLKDAPDIPTVAEAGMPDLRFEAYYGLLAPKGTPAPIIERLNRALTEAMASPKVHEQLKSLNTGVAPDTSAKYFADYIRAELARWRPVIKATGIKSD